MKNELWQVDFSLLATAEANKSMFLIFKHTIVNT